MAAQHWRHLWNPAARLDHFTFWWPIIKNDSFVLITAAEARISAHVPDRFMGDAKPIVAGNIAAHTALWSSHSGGLGISRISTSGRT